jgi:hypothetical protein
MWLALAKTGSRQINTVLIEVIGSMDITLQDVLEDRV